MLVQQHRLAHYPDQEALQPPDILSRSLSRHSVQPAGNFQSRIELLALVKQLAIAVPEVVSKIATTSQPGLPRCARSCSARARALTRDVVTAGAEYPFVAIRARPRAI